MQEKPETAWWDLPAAEVNSLDGYALDRAVALVMGIPPRKPGAGRPPRGTRFGVDPSQVPRMVAWLHAARPTLTMTALLAPRTGVRIRTSDSIETVGRDLTQAVARMLVRVGVRMTPDERFAVFAKVGGGFDGDPTRLAFDLSQEEAR